MKCPQEQKFKKLFFLGSVDLLVLALPCPAPQVFPLPYETFPALHLQNLHWVLHDRNFSHFQIFTYQPDSLGEPPFQERIQRLYQGRVDWVKTFFNQKLIRLREGCEKKKTGKKRVFCQTGGGGSRMVVKCQTAILEKYFFSQHVESFQDPQNMFYTWSEVV